MLELKKEIDKWKQIYNCALCNYNSKEKSHKYVISQGTNYKYISTYKFDLKHENKGIKMKLQNKGKESENSYQKLNRSLKDRHTKTHGNCIEIFRQAWPSLSIGREKR